MISNLLGLCGGIEAGDSGLINYPVYYLKISGFYAAILLPDVDVQAMAFRP